MLPVVLAAWCGGCGLVWGITWVAVNVGLLRLMLLPGSPCKRKGEYLVLLCEVVGFNRSDVQLGSRGIPTQGCTPQAVDD